LSAALNAVAVAACSVRRSRLSATGRLGCERLDGTAIARLEYASTEDERELIV
jgi:hypothetical protein